jgi:hypothetical protein
MLTCQAPDMFIIIVHGCDCARDSQLVITLVRNSHHQFQHLLVMHSCMLMICYLVYVPEGRMMTSARGHHILLSDQTKYVVQLRNDNTWPCNCYLTIDDTHMGTFRLRPRSR